MNAAKIEAACEKNDEKVGEEEEFWNSLVILIRHNFEFSIHL